VFCEPQGRPKKQSQPYGAGLVVNHHLWQATQEVIVRTSLQIPVHEAYWTVLLLEALTFSLRYIRGRDKKS